MDEPTSNFHKFVSVCNDVLALGKDFSIVLLVVLFLFFGTFLKHKLDDLGVSEIWGIKLKEVQQQNQDAKAAALQVSSLDQRLSDLETELVNISDRNPSVAKEIAPIKDEVSALNGQINSADRYLKTTLLSQQEVLGKASVQSVETTGWIYVGQEDEAKQSWVGVGARNLSSPPSTPTFQVGQTLTLSSDIYVHSSPPSGAFHTQGDVVAAWKQGERVEVLDIDTSHAKMGGWFIWLKVKRLG